MQVLLRGLNLIWRWLLCSPAIHNDCFMLELPGA